MTKAQAAFLEKLQSLTFSTGKGKPAKTVSCDHCGGEWEVKPLGEIEVPIGKLQFGMMRQVKPGFWKN